MKCVTVGGVVLRFLWVGSEKRGLFHDSSRGCRSSSSSGENDAHETCTLTSCAVSKALKRISVSRPRALWGFEPPHEDVQVSWNDDWVPDWRWELDTLINEGSYGEHSGFGRDSCRVLFGTSIYRFCWRTYTTAPIHFLGTGSASAKGAENK